MIELPNKPANRFIEWFKTNYIVFKFIIKKLIPKYCFQIYYKETYTIIFMVCIHLYTNQFSRLINTSDEKSNGKEMSVLMIE